MTKPESGQLWLGRNNRSLLKVLRVDGEVIYAKMLATNNEWIKDQVGSTRKARRRDWPLMVEYVGDLISSPYSL